LDVGGTSQVGFREFVRACNGEDNCQLEILARCFRPRSQKHLRRLLDSTHQHIQDGIFGNQITSEHDRNLQEEASIRECSVKSIREHEMKPMPLQPWRALCVALEEEHLALAAEVRARLAALESALGAKTVENTSASAESQTMQLKELRVPSAEARDPCLRTYSSSMEEMILQLQQQPSLLEGLHNALNAMNPGVVEFSDLEQRHEALLADFSKEAGRLEQGTRDIDSVIALVQDDLAGLRSEMCRQISKLHEKCQVFADRLVLLEMDMSAHAGQSTGSARCVQQPQQQQQEQFRMAWI